MVGAFGDMVCVRSLCGWELHKKPQLLPSYPQVFSSYIQLWPASCFFNECPQNTVQQQLLKQPNDTQNFTVSVFWYSWGYGPFEENCLNYSIWKHDHLPYFFSEHPSSHRSSGSITFHSCWAHPEAFHLMAALKQTSWIHLLHPHPLAAMHRCISK